LEFKTFGSSAFLVGKNTTKITFWPLYERIFLLLKRGKK